MNARQSGRLINTTSDVPGTMTHLFDLISFQRPWEMELNGSTTVLGERTGELNCASSGLDEDERSTSGRAQDDIRLRPKGAG